MLLPNNRWHSVSVMMKRRQLLEDCIGFVEMEKAEAEAMSTATVTAIRDVGQLTGSRI